MRGKAARDLQQESVPGLATLDSSSVERALGLGRLVHIPENWSPIHAHEPADEAYLILEGRLRVDRNDQVVADLGPGDFAGEMGLVEHSLRNARVTVTEPALAIAWPRKDFELLRRELDDFDDLVTATAFARSRENKSGD